MGYKGGGGGGKGGGGGWSGGKGGGGGWSGGSKGSGGFKSHKGASNSKGKQYYVYTLNLEGGKKYVGHTGNPKARMEQHFSGSGSEVTKACAPVSVHSMNKCSSQEAAKNAERIVYENMKNYHGSDMVRGAGNTRRF